MGWKQSNLRPLRLSCPVSKPPRRATAEGAEFYFDADNVVRPAFADLQDGDEVHFIADLSGDTPRALLGKIKPEPEDERALVGAHALEAVDLIDRAHQVLRLARLEHAIDDRRGVPGAEQDADASLRGQDAPVVTHRRALALLVGRVQRGNRSSRRVGLIAG
jgi:hypothetical protein